MFTEQGVAKRMPITFIFPTRIRHHPIEVVEHAGDQKVRSSLCRRQRCIDRELVFLRDIGKNGLTVADYILAIDDIGQLTARCFCGIKNMLVAELHSCQLEKCIYLQAVAIIVGDAEQRGIGVKREHDDLPLKSNYGTRFPFLSSLHVSFWSIPSKKDFERIFEQY